MPDKAERIYNFHANPLKALKGLLAASSISHPSELGPEHVVRRVSSNEVRSLANLHLWMKPGELLSGVPDHPCIRCSRRRPKATVLRCRRPCSPYLRQSPTETSFRDSQ